MSIIHFGVKIQEKTSNKINKESYLAAKPEHMTGWSDDDYPRQILKASLNYDLNMQFFNSLDKSKFAAYIAKQSKKFKMKECFDLNELACVEGLYMLVLDEYKQVYIGISTNIKKRIQSHWSSKKSLERLIFGDVCSSVLSIDSFGPLDTTRIFYIKAYSLYELEQKVVDAFDLTYTLNRTAGGIGTADTYTDTTIMAKMAIVANRRKKNFIPFIDVKLLKATVTETEFERYIDKYPDLKEKL